MVTVFPVQQNFTTLCSYPCTGHTSVI